MKISSEMRFPHPVLNAETLDFKEGNFKVDLKIEENLDTNELKVSYLVGLTEPTIKKMIDEGIASIGMFVKCGDTYYSSLEKLDLSGGVLEFKKGLLINEVTLRPLIWLNNSCQWSSNNFHEEFSSSLSMEKADLIGMDEEIAIHVGNAKMTPLESIFEVSENSSLNDNEFSVSLDEEKISIIAGSEIYKKIINFRANHKGRTLNKASIYLPVIMEILSTFPQSANEHRDKRWFEPFMARCVLLGINIEQINLLTDAQKILDYPWADISLQEGDDF